MLWSVIEALDKRNIVLRGPLGADIARVRRALKKCRNAIMHVPDDTACSIFASRTSSSSKTSSSRSGAFITAVGGF